MRSCEPVSQAEWITEKVHAYIKAWISRLAAITADNSMLCGFGKHALLQVLGQIIFDDKLAFDNTLSASMCASVAMAVIVVLRLLHGVDHVRYSLYVFLLVWGNILYSLILPINIRSRGHYPLVF